MGCNCCCHCCCHFFRNSFWSLSTFSAGDAMSAEGTQESHLGKQQTCCFRIPHFNRVAVSSVSSVSCDCQISQMHCNFMQLLFQPYTPPAFLHCIHFIFERHWRLSLLLYAFVCSSVRHPLCAGPHPCNLCRKPVRRLCS